MSNKVQNHKKVDSGRSMVEMLGVLTVIGVLSAVGITGFSLAKNKHKASELLNEANKRATIVAIQATQGRETLSISEFTNNQKLNFSEIVGHDTVNRQFTLTIEHVNEAVCNQMQNIKGALIRKFEPAACSEDVPVVLTYNDDLSTEETAGDYTFENCPENFYQCATMNTCVAREEDCAECPANSSTTGTGTGTITGTGCKCDANYKTNADETACIPAGTQYMKGTVSGQHDILEANNGCPDGYSWVTKESLEGLSDTERAGIFSDSTICENCSGSPYWLQDRVGSSAYYITTDGAVSSIVWNYYNTRALCVAVNWPACPAHSSTTGSGTGTITGTNCKCNVNYKINEAGTACIPPTTPYTRGLKYDTHYILTQDPGCFEGFTWVTYEQMAEMLQNQRPNLTDPTVCENCAAGVQYWLQGDSGTSAYYIYSTDRSLSSMYRNQSRYALCVKQ